MPESLALTAAGCRAKRMRHTLARIPWWGNQPRRPPPRRFWVGSKIAPPQRASQIVLTHPKTVP